MPNVRMLVHIRIDPVADAIAASQVSTPTLIQAGENDELASS